MELGGGLGGLRGAGRVCLAQGSERGSRCPRASAAGLETPEPGYEDPQRSEGSLQCDSRPPGPRVNFATALVELAVCSPFIFLPIPVTSEQGSMFPQGTIPKKTLSSPSQLRVEARARRFSGEPR